MRFKPLTAIIIDDEPSAIHILKADLTRIGNIDVVETTSNPVNTIDLIQKHHPDLVFLDVQMPERNGIEVLREIAELQPSSSVVMVTAYNDFMLEAFRFAAFDYLLKPVDPEQLHEMLERYRQRERKVLERNRVNALVDYLKRIIRIPSVYETYFFNPDQIFYFEADGKYTHIIQADGKRLTTSINLGAVQELLPEGEFCRISKSHIIHLKYLRKIDRRKKCCCIAAGNLETNLTYSKLFTCKIEQMQ
jgi:two-component system, LytTR family, response regulator